jgi:hypothetical protein
MHLRANQVLSRSSVARYNTLNALVTLRVLILSLVLLQKIQNIQIRSRGEDEASGAKVIICQENLKKPSHLHVHSYSIEIIAMTA